MYCAVLLGQVRGRDVLPPDLAEAQVLPLQLHPARSPHQHPRPVGPTLYRSQASENSAASNEGFTITEKAPTSCWTGVIGIIIS